MMKVTKVAIGGEDKNMWHQLWQNHSETVARIFI